HPIRKLDRRIPVDLLLRSDSIEGRLDRIAELKYQELETKARAESPNLQASERSSLSTRLAQLQEEQTRVRDEYDRLKGQADDLEAKAKQAEEAGRKSEAQDFRVQAARLHSDPIPLEMTFTVYRTTKGTIGAPVTASLKAINPRTNEDYSLVFSVREY